MGACSFAFRSYLHKKVFFLNRTSHVYNLAGCITSQKLSVAVTADRTGYDILYSYNADRVLK